MLALLVWDQTHLILAHSSHWVNEDHALLWDAGRDLGSLHLYQPNFYGQSYFTVFGALPGEIMRSLGVGIATAGASSSALLAILSWLVLGAAAWRRGRRVVGLLAVAAPVLLSTDSLLAASSAGGRDAGSFLACVGVAVLLWSPRSARHVALFVAIAGLGVAWDFGSALLVVPVAAFAVLENRGERRTLLAGAVALAVPAAWMAATWLFYRAHPDYDVYRAGNFWPRGHSLWDNLTHVSRYLAPAEPELARWYVIPLLLALVLTALLVSTGKVAYALPPVLGIVGFLYALSTNKINFAVGADYLWFGRFFLALPFLLWFFGYLVAEGRPVPLPSAQAGLAVAAVLVLVVATFTVRMVTFDQRMADVVKQSQHDKFGAVSRVSTVLLRCDDIAAAARQLGTNLVVFRTEVITPYACDAAHYGSLETLYPAFERRTWRLHDESRRKRTAILVVDAPDTWCDHVRPLVTNCEEIGELNGVVLLQYPAQPLFPLWQRIGEHVRHFDRP